MAYARRRPDTGLAAAGWGGDPGFDAGLSAGLATADRSGVPPRTRMAQRLQARRPPSDGSGQLLGLRALVGETRSDRAASAPDSSAAWRRKWRHPRGVADGRAVCPWRLRRGVV